MAITISQQPDDICFSGNPIIVKLQSDAANGVAFSGSLDRSRLLVPGKKLLFQFGDQTVEMTQTDKPNDTGTQFPVTQNGQILKASGFVPYFSANNTLNKYYIIEAKDDETMCFRARSTGTFYNWKPNTDLVVDKLGVDQKNNFKFLFEVFFRNAGDTDFKNVYTEELNQDSSFSGDLTLDISSILDACLANETPDSSVKPRLCVVSKGEYYCRFSEMSGIPPVPGKGIQTEVKHVIKGGLSHIGLKTKTLVNILQPSPADASRDAFLKQGGRTRPLKIDQPEALFFVSLRESVSQLRLKTVIDYTDQSTNPIVSSAIAVKKYDKIAFQIEKTPPLATKTPQQYSCFLIDQADNIVSEVITYTIDNQPRDQARYFLYTSSFGGLDTLVTFGRGSEEYEITGQTVNKPQPLSYELYNGNRVTFDLRLQRTFTVATGWLDRRAFDLLSDFFLSEKKWIIKNSTPLPITVTNKKAGEYHDLSPLIAQSFEYRLDFEDDYYTEGDAL
ncbi:MAG: hypothetical protein U0X71_04720 [Sphingobacteriaceae bacterium]